MAFETLKTLINDKIKSGLPTGIRPEEEHNPVLQSIVSTFGQDYIYMGLATPSTSPSTDDNARMYITNGGGTYTNFLDNTTSPIVVENGSICFLKGVSGTYSKDVIMDGESILDNTKLRIDDNGTYLVLEALVGSTWTPIGKFSHDGVESTYETLNADDISAEELSAESIVTDSMESNSLSVGGATPVSLKGLAGGMSITKQRQEQVGGDKIVNTAANSLAELSDADVLGKAALVYAPFTSRADYTDSLVPSHDYGRFDFARSSSKYVTSKDGLLNYLPENTPSYEYDNGVEPYLLTEPASTNLITYPKSFIDSYWSKSGSSIEGDPSTAGSELVINGDFSSTTGWTIEAPWSIGSSIASYDKLSSNNIRRTDCPIVSGKNYRVEFEILNCTGSAHLSVYDSSSGTLYFDNEDWGNGSYVRYFNASVSSDGIAIWGNTAGDAFDLDNISVKEVQPFEAPMEKPSVSSELVTNGDFTTDSDWTKSSNWTIGSGVASCDGSTTGSLSQTTLSAVIGNTYKISVDIISTDGSMRVDFGGFTSSFLTTVGTHTFYITASSTTSFSFQLGSTVAGSIDNVSVKEVTSWSGGGLERDAYKLVESDETAHHQMNPQSFTISNSTDYRVSIYAKAGERDFLRLRWSDGDTREAWFNLSNGTIGTESSTSATITPMANGWYRCEVGGVSTATTGTLFVSPSTADNEGSYQGDGTSGIYIAYAQLEEQASATSLMLPATEGSTSSRVGDVVINGGSQSLFGGVSASGVLYAEIAALADDGTFRYISLSDGTSNNRVNILYPDNTNYIRVIIKVGGVSVIDGSYTSAVVTDFHKIAVRWELNSFQLYVDGVERVTDASGVSFAADVLTTLQFDQGAGANIFYGKTKGLAVFEYLSDAEMVTLTTL